MSRTVRGEKGAGYDYQGRRLGNTGHCGGCGPSRKRSTHSRERARDRDLCKMALKGKNEPDLKATKEGDRMPCPACNAPDRQYYDPNIHPVTEPYPEDACWFNLWDGAWECGECWLK